MEDGAAASMPASMSCSVRSGCHKVFESSSGMRVSVARSHTQPSTSVSHDRYSNAPPCGSLADSVASHSYIDDGRSGMVRGAQPMTCSSCRTSAAGLRYSSENEMPDRMSSTWRTVAPS